MTEIVGIHHVTSVGADPDRTFKFYTDTLGLRLVRKRLTLTSHPSSIFILGTMQAPRVIFSRSSSTKALPVVGEGRVK